MHRAVAVASLALVACGRSQGVPDEQLGDLVIAPKQTADPIEVDRAAKDPAELGRALALSHHETVAALGAYTVAIDLHTIVHEADKQVSDLAEHTVIEHGDKGAYHALYNNSADYGREVTFTAGKLYLRPRYQRWHARAPETADEPQKIADTLADTLGATWDLVAPAAELTDQGGAQVAGHAGRKIAVKLTPNPRPPATESLAQRKWRQTRTVGALAGEVILDADHGMPLSVKLDATIGFQRDGRAFQMKLALVAAASAIGQPTAITAPAGDDVVATPERQREVDDRDFLLQGIAPPLRKSADAAAAPVPAPGSAGPAPSSTKKP